MTDFWHGIDRAWGMVCIALLLFMPGIDLLTEKDFSQINFTTLFFIGGAMSIGAVATEVGMARKVAEIVADFLLFDMPFTHLCVSYFLGMFTLLFLTPLTGMVSMSVPITELALQINLDPRVVMYSFVYGMDQYFFPYQYAGLFFWYSFKRVKFKYLLQVLAAKVIAVTIILFPLAMLYWHIVGLW